jgi:hypothetical protein
MFHRLQQVATDRLDLSVTWLWSELVFVSTAYLFFLLKKPPDKYFRFENVVLEVKGRRRRLLQGLILLLQLLVVIFAFGWNLSLGATIKSPSTVPATDAAKHNDFNDIYRLIDELNSTHYAFPSADHSTARDIGHWDSDNFPIVVDSATSRTITPVFADLTIPGPIALPSKASGRARLPTSVRFDGLFMTSTAN